MAGQKEDSKRPRQAIIPPVPTQRLESRVPTLPPPAPAQPEPLASGIDKEAGRKPAPPAVSKHRTLPRITRLSEFLAELDKTAKPPASPVFDRDTYEFMRRVRGAPGKREPMDWSDVKAVKREESLPSLVETLTNGFPATEHSEVPKGTPQEMDLLSRKIWIDAGLPRLLRKKKEAQKEEPPDIKKSLDHWCISLNNAAKEVLLDSLIEDTVKEFSALKRASKEGAGGLITICSGGRPSYPVESTVSAPVATISDQFLRKFNAMKSKGVLSEADARTLVEQLVRFVFHNPRPVEGSEITETEMRNGFFRAVAWCICTRTNPALFQEFFSRNNILLIDAVGIAAGLNSDDAKAAMGEAGVRSALYRLMKKRWVATGFEHLKEMLRTDSERGRLDPRAAFHFTTVLFREVGEYQRIVQSYSVLARNMGNLSRASRMVGPPAPGVPPLEEEAASVHRKTFHGMPDIEFRHPEMQEEPKEQEESGDVLYLSEKEFMACLLSRGDLPPALRAGIDAMHGFVARLFSRRKNSPDQEGYQYVVGRSPAEISDIFNTVLEGLDFFIGDPKMRRIALEAIQHYGIAEGESQPTSFKKLFALCLFMRSMDVRDYGRLYRLLLDYSNPIVSDISADHYAYLLARDMFLLLHDEKPQESRPTLSAEDLAQILAEGDNPF